MLGEFAEIVYPQFYYYGKSENSVLILLPTFLFLGIWILQVHPMYL